MNSSKHSILQAAFTFVSLTSLTACDPTEEQTDSDATTTGIADDETSGAMSSGGTSAVASGEEPMTQSEVFSTVSPALFDLISRWPRGSRSALGEQTSLTEFVRQSNPSLLQESEDLIDSFNKLGWRNNCTCNILASADANPITKTVEPGQEWAPENWASEADGAAHRGDLYRYAKHGLTSTSRTRENHTTMSLQLVCLDGEAQYCDASCSGKMFIYSEYGTSVSAWAKTGGIWSKGAHGAAADGAKLTYEAPFVAPLVLFEKVGSVSHHANSTAFSPDEAINVVRGALSIVTAVKTSGIAGVDWELVTKTVASLSKLIQRSGNNGITQNEMFVAYDSRNLPPFNIMFSPQVAQVHKLRLTSSGSNRNRGWGGTNEDSDRYASGYLMAVAVDYFQCTNAAAPQRGGIWRYATTQYAPYSVDTLRGMTQSFFTVLGVNVNVQQSSGKTW